jgi:hypothetical protein
MCPKISINFSGGGDEGFFACPVTKSKHLKMIISRYFLHLSVAGLWLSLLAACTSGEVKPIVLTREAEVSDEYGGWASGAYQTGLVLREEAGEPAIGNYVYLEMSIPQPGRYYPWMLAALDRGDTTARRQLRITITPVRAHSQSRVDSVLIDIRPNRALTWMTGAGRDRGLDFPEQGAYFFTIEGVGQEEARIILDKMLLTSHPNFEPKGFEWVNDTVRAVLPPAWAFGVLYGGAAGEQSLQRVDRILDAGLPVDGYWFDSLSLHGQNQGREYNTAAALVQALEVRGIRAGLRVGNSMRGTDDAELFDAFESQGYFAGASYEDDGGRLTGDIDFENPDAGAFWRRQLAPFFNQGLDFLLLGGSASTDFAREAFAATQEAGSDRERRGFIFSPLSMTHDPELKRFPAALIGAGSENWNHADDWESLRENVLAAADPRRSTYGIPFLAHDPGGARFTGGDSFPLRWLQFAMFTPVTTFFSAPGRPAGDLPVASSPRVLENFRYYGRLRMCLFPYRYTYAHLTRHTGEKMIRGDSRYNDQYLFGEELLVAPVTEPGAEERTIYLPPGQWFDYYDHTVHAGDTVLRYPAPADRLPLLVRAGSIIPLRPYARSIETGSNDTLLLQVYPGAVEGGAFTLWEDDGLSNGYQRGQTARTTFRYRQRDGRINLLIGAVEGAYDDMAPQRTYEAAVLLPVAPVSLQLNGDPLPASAWSYDTGRRLLSVQMGTLARDRQHELEIR